MKWFPLCNYTHYSLQKAFSKPKQLAKKCAKNSYPACGIADYQSISGAVSFYQACVANDVKPIIGCAFDGFTLFAKNKAGWLELIRIVSTVDDEGSVNKGLLVKLANNGNMICVAKDEALSPISGEDFYVKTEAFSNTYYAEKEHSVLHRILLCSGMKQTLPQIKKLLNKRQQVDNQEFFECNDFYLKDRAETAAMLINDPQMEVFDEIFNKIENYNILNKPMLPNFSTPDGLTQKEYLRLLVEDAWSKMEGSIKEQDRQVYRDRIEREFGVIEGADLFGYFLIVRDIIDYCRSQGWMVGPGRGSAAGCLISFLIGITQIDPILYDLLFERFYNAGRNTEDHVSLPDIDIDVPGGKRDEIILYLKEKYGHSNVSQMCTFGRLQGRSAIKEVMRVNNACGFGEMNEITRHIPDEAAISDQLAEMDEEDRSIIRWALLNNADDLRDYCYIDEDGQLKGDYAEYFQQAIDIEGTFKTQGKHAAGVVISAEPLYEVCPMVNQKSGGEKIAGLEMNDLEALGHVKFDVLGINLLDKLMYIEELLGKGVDK
jgi:DNA polymerase III subunit alpha